MFQKAKQTGRATWPALVLILAATMRGSLAQIGDFAKGDGEQTATLDAAIKAVTLAKSIPAIFPPGSALTELPSKSGAAPTWDDVDRFLDAQKHLVIETSKLLVPVNDGNKETIARQVETPARPARPRSISRLTAPAAFELLVWKEANMAMGNQIRSPIEWVWDYFKQTGHAVGSAAHSMEDAWESRDAAPLTVRRISTADLRDVLARGLADFGAYRTDVVFLCLLYPIAGLLLSRLAFGYGMLPLIFPLASGFALIAPFFAVGLCEMSRRREEGSDTGWIDAFGVARSHSLGAIMALGLMLLANLILWLFAAYFVYAVTLGPEPPESVTSFVRDVLTTPAGWTMAGVGVCVGFLFALLVLTISVVSFPLLLDRDVGVYTAVSTSIHVVLANPGPMAMWGLIIAASLAVGVIPLLFGLAIVLPVLGHATWHLYRKVLPR